MSFILPTNEVSRHPGAAHLDDLIAAREVAFALWYVGTAQVNPAFRTRLDDTLADSGKLLDALRIAA